jgi:hypothetical protein
MRVAAYYWEFPQPPSEVYCPATPQAAITIALAVLCAAVFVVGLVTWRRTGTPLLLMASLGGAVASVNEPVMDILARVWFYDGGGQWTAFTTYGRPIPIWLPMAYFAFFGAAPYFMARYLRKGFLGGSDSFPWWRAAAVPVGLNLLLEMPLLQSGLYIYYGYQPYTVLGLPLYWCLINGLAVMLDCAIMLRLGHLFTGPRVLLYLLVPVFTQLTAGAVGVPIYALGNAGVTGPGLWLAGAATFGLGIACFHLVGRITRDPSLLTRRGGSPALGAAILAARS